MKLLKTSICLISLILLSHGQVLAASNQNLQNRIDNLEKKFKGLEKKDAKADHLDKLSERLSFSGLVEVEGIYNSNYQDEASSGLELATLELGVDAHIHEHVSSHVLLLYEESTPEDIEVDSALITLSTPTELPVSITAGRQYLPFGTYKTAMVSDPLTLELAESRETALKIRVEEQGAYGSLYAFNGDVDENNDSENHIDNFGANVGYQMGTDDLATDMSVSYLNNIGDSDTLGDTLQNQSNGTQRNYVPGMAASCSVDLQSFTLIGEYITALEGFQQNEIPYDGNGANVSAWNAELDYSFRIEERETTVAVAYQGSAEASGLELPQSRYMAAVSVGLLENNLSLSLEYALDQDYERDKGGTGNEAQTVTTQLAMSF